MTEGPGHSTAFRQFGDSLLDDTQIGALASSAGLRADVVRRHVEMGLGEAAQTLRLLEGLPIPSDARVLEIGAGVGLTSCFLAGQGWQVTALEPGGEGFEDHQRLSAALVSHLGVDLTLLTIPAEQLDPAVHGRFDVVFSNNVVEHVDDPVRLLVGLQRMLTDGGLSVHSCPNYRIPFEPHFGLPLVPARPRLTEHLLPRGIADSGLWRSLNFITAADVARAARSAGVRVVFRKGTVAASLRRLTVDHEFRRRHPALGRVAGLLERARLVDALDRLPASWATPMDFVLSSRGDVPDSWVDAARQR